MYTNEADMLWIVVTYAPGTAHKTLRHSNESDLRAPQGDRQPDKPGYCEREDQRRDQ
ncbi:hypothetical protein Rhe02_33680 [Rhizocola hellebori]|uniref:Uncharacterized protein n=1 Tax=Rhizocola hellebori TaxID=1392758 RepID=A0A8J3Q8U7_9ACTN|nr:hypothetical protein Rhe02_33680 [Rhizocola hellebori]